jgi:hypothetical protein
MQAAGRHQVFQCLFGQAAHIALPQLDLVGLPASGASLRESSASKMAAVTDCGPSPVALRNRLSATLAVALT